MFTKHRRDDQEIRELLMKRYCLDQLTTEYDPDTQMFVCFGFRNGDLVFTYKITKGQSEGYYTAMQAVAANLMDYEDKYNFFNDPSQFYTKEG